MTYLFIDESGDLGMGKKSSEWLILTLLVSHDRPVINGLIQGITKTIEQNRDHAIKELHAHKARDWVREDVLAGLPVACSGCRVLCVAINKRKLHDQLRNKGKLLYDYGVDTLLDHLYAAKLVAPEDDMELVIDERGANDILRREFERYVDNNLEVWGPGNVTVRARPSHEEPGLQAVDFVSWALFRKYEHGDTKFYNLVKSIILEEHLIPAQ